MPIWWRDAATVLRDMLRQRGLDPDRVESPDAAWKVFCDFIAIDVNGLETGPDSDSDGFAVSWGRYSWNDGLPTLSFNRAFAVDVSADRTEEDRTEEGRTEEGRTEEDWYQPEYWRVSDLARLRRRRG